VSTEDRDKLRHLDGDLKRVIFGQDPAIDKVVANIKLARAGIGHQQQAGRVASCSPAPRASARPSSRSQLALALGVEFLRFDMSEYMEQHSVSRLIGAPPGLRRLRAGRPAHRRRAQDAPLRARARRDREGAPDDLQHPAPGHGLTPR
jgi:hypothetical protein